MNQVERGFFYPVIYMIAITEFSPLIASKFGIL
jgi:hypothetical protein